MVSFEVSPRPPDAGASTVVYGGVEDVDTARATAREAAGRVRPHA